MNTTRTLANGVPGTPVLPVLRCVFAGLVLIYTLCACAADETPATAQPSNASGITKVSQGRPVLTEPGDNTKGQVLRYGFGLVFQVGPRTAAVACNIRTTGTGHWDWENGADVIVFDNLTTIGRQKRVAIIRNEEDRNPATGKRRVAVVYPTRVGFVPLGAKRSDGSPHPDAGTGFGFSQALCYDLNDQGYYTPIEARSDGQAASTQRWYVHQFAYDGKTFRVVKTDVKPDRAPLKTPDGEWTITERGLCAAIPDGDDLLLPMSANNGKRAAAGVSRWRREGGDWRLVAFHAVSSGMEPTLVRDVDGSLLYSDRDNEVEAVRVWRSRDSGQTWQQVLYVPKLRSNAPVALVQAADGTPYIAANQPGSFRATLCLWPLNAERSACGAAIVARDCNGEFGPAPKGTIWFADIPTGATVRLADGLWRHLLSYRILAFGMAGAGGEKLTPRTGCYIERVFSTGAARPAWRF